MLSILISLKTLLSKPVHAPCIPPSSMPRELATDPPTPRQLLCVSHPGTSLGVICHLVRHLCSIRSAALYHPRHCPMMQSCHNQPFPSGSSVLPCLPILQCCRAWNLKASVFLPWCLPCPQCARIHCPGCPAPLPVMEQL